MKISPRVLGTCLSRHALFNIALHFVEFVGWNILRVDLFGPIGKDKRVQEDSQYGSFVFCVVFGVLLGLLYLIRKCLGKCNCVDADKD